MKISVNKVVFWHAANKIMSGQVKQIMGDHVLVKADCGDYLVRKSACSGKPMGKIASLVYAAKDLDKEQLPDEVTVEVNLDTLESKMIWGDAGAQGCSEVRHPEIKTIDDIWRADAEWSNKQLNPQFLPRTQVNKPLKQKEEETDIEKPKQQKRFDLPPEKETQFE